MDYAKWFLKSFMTKKIIILRIFRINDTSFKKII